MILRWPAWLLASGLVMAASAGTVAEDWEAITALDRGPQVQARSLEEARSVAAGHLDRQEKALRTFLAAHPQDEHAFEARLRLVRLLDIRGGFQGSEKARVEAAQMLAALEKTATPEQQAEIEFAKVTRLMRGAQKAPTAARTQLLSAARKFQVEHPGDRRVAALLAEVATLFDGQPRIKTALLTDANALATDPGLKVRIADDLRRVDLLGTPIALKFTSVQGKEFNVEEFRGQLVMVVFFADFSPPSTEALGRVQKAITELPKGSVAAVGINLDPKREALDAAIKASGLTWPVAFDGKSWSGELVRSFGINALPTVWLLDKQGKLRSLNALEGTAEQARQLLNEK
ncbi:MAG: TlpA disulfide reductase family protein [Chthoniobacteraceae bacterium]